MGTVLVVGAGLAGGAAALALADAGHAVTVVTAGRAGDGAGALAALVNPFAGPNAHPAWAHAAALDAARALLARLGRPWAPAGVLRPARDARQVSSFQARAVAHPADLDWIEADAVRERWEDVRAPLGALWVRTAGVAEGTAAALGDALRSAHAAGRLVLRESVRVTDAGEAAGEAWAVTASGERLSAGHVLLAPGAGSADIAALAPIGLHAVKGETVEAALPAGARVPAVAAGAYAVPGAGGSVTLGGTYVHAFADLAPTPGVRETLAARLQPYLPGLTVAPDAPVRVGVRVGVAGTRRPFVGPVPGHARVWAAVGFGSKGLLHAPLVAARLAGWLARPETIPPELRGG